MTPPIADCPAARARADGGGVTVTLRVRPGARREGIAGVTTEADGAARLKIAVSAPAEDGRANARVIALLARRWRLPKSAFAVVAGARDRRKTMLVTGDAATILARIAADADCTRTTT